MVSQTFIMMQSSPNDKILLNMYRYSLKGPLFSTASHVRYVGGHMLWNVKSPSMIDCEIVGGQMSMSAVLSSASTTLVQ